VDQAGQDRLALQIHHLRARSLHLEDVRVRPHVQDAAALDGEGLVDGELTVHGDDLAVVQDQVRFRRRERTRRRGGGQDTAEKPPGGWDHGRCRLRADDAFPSAPEGRRKVAAGPSPRRAGPEYDVKDATRLAAGVFLPPGSPDRPEVLSMFFLRSLMFLLSLA